jgi:hypothetical protein
MKKLISDEGFKRIAQAVNTSIDGLDDFTEGYIEAALWASVDDEGEPLSENYSEIDIAPDTLEEIKNDCKDFQESNEELLERAYEATGNSPSRAGFDFYLNRNGHGAGFWDGHWDEFGDDLSELSDPYGTMDMYVEDGTVYSNG